MYVRQTSQSGMTLVEMLLALGIFSFVALAAFSFIFPYFFMTQRLRASMTDVVDNDIAVRMLMREMENSYVIRTDGLSCGVMDSFLKTSDPFDKNQPRVKLEPGKKISFPYSVFAGLSSRDLNSTNGLFVTDYSQYPKDSLVLAVNPDDASHFGFFKVDSVDPVANRVILGSATLAGNPTLCAPTGLPETLNQLFSAKGAVSLVLHRVRIVSYLRGTEDKETVDKVYRSSWPDEGANAAEPKSLFFNGLIEANFYSGWEAYRDDVASSVTQRSGKWTAEMKYTVFQKSMVNQQSSKDHKGEKVYDIVSRTSYDLSGSRRTNTSVSTTASSAVVKYPTCSVVSSDADFEIGHDSVPSLQGTKAYTVTGTVSEDVASSITIQFLPYGLPPTGKKSAFASCYDENEVHKDGNKVLEPGPPSATLSKTNDGYSKYVCLVYGSMNVVGQMSYFDEGTQRTIPVSCSGGVANAPYSYDFSGDKFKCFKDGFIEYGSPLVDSETKKPPGPTLTADSCDWTGTNAGDHSCDPALHDDGELITVHFGPKGTILEKDSLDLSCQ